MFAQEHPKSWGIANLVVSRRELEHADWAKLPVPHATNRWLIGGTKGEAEHLPACPAFCYLTKKVAGTQAVTRAITVLQLACHWQAFQWRVQPDTEDLFVKTDPKCLRPQIYAYFRRLEDS